MPEVIYLSIIYKTEHAASSLRSLNPIQERTHKGLRNIESGMKSLAMSALGVPGPVGKVAEGLLRFGTGGMVTLTVVAGIGLIAGAYKLATADAERLAKASGDLEKQLASFGSPRAKLVEDLSSAGVALKKFQDEAALFAPGSTAGGAAGFIARFKAGPERGALWVAALHAAGEEEAIQKRIKELIATSDAEHAAALKKSLELEKERAAEAARTAFLLKGEQDVLFHRAVVDAAASRGRTQANLGNIRFGPDVVPRSLDLGFGQRPDTTLTGGLDHKFGEGVGLGGGALNEPLNNAITRQQQRIVDSWTAGMEIMQESMEDFLVTGKFAIQQLIDDLLRIAFRAATDQFVQGAVQAVAGAAAKSSAFRRAITKP